MRFLPIVLAAVATSIASTSASAQQPEQIQARAVGTHNNLIHHRRLSNLFALSRRDDSTAVAASAPERPERKQKSEASELQQAEIDKAGNARKAIVVQGSGTYSVKASEANSFLVNLTSITARDLQDLEPEVYDEPDEPEDGSEGEEEIEDQPVQKRAACKPKTTSTRTTTTKKPAATTSKVTTPVVSVAPASGRMIIGGYWPSWSDLAPEDIDWSLFDLMSFAFATPTTSGGVAIASWDEPLLKRLVAAGHAGGAKVIVSIGGWDNSQGFSPSVATASMRTTFATSMAAFIKKYDLDGVDLDWEYPNSAFATNYSPADAANFQTFLQTLRATLGTKLLITAAVSDDTWISSTGGVVSNVKRAAGALSYIMIMNYDVWGGSSNPGPNAPLDNLCGNSTQPRANAVAAVRQWGAAGMPKKKMLLGVPYYGYVQNSSKRQLKQRSLAGRPRRSDDPRLQSTEEVQKRATALATGQMNFDKLFQNKALKRGTGSRAGEYVAVSPWKKYWDDCSNTPFLANGEQVITYDDTDSLYDKAAYARLAGLGGTSMWSVDGDTNYWNLTRAMRSGMDI